MLSFRINEDQTIWAALIVSLMIHGFFLVFSGKTFIQHPQYSVRPSSQMVEVSIEETKIDNHSESASPTKVTAFGGIPSKGGTFRNDRGLKKKARFISGVKVKANSDYFQNPSPEYPELAKQMRQEGLVMLSVDVNREGDPVDVAIIQSCGYRLLDQAALRAVRHWKFQPGSMGGITVDSTVTVPIRFRLEK